MHDLPENVISHHGYKRCKPTDIVNARDTHRVENHPAHLSNLLDLLPVRPFRKFTEVPRQPKAEVSARGVPHEDDVLPKQRVSYGCVCGVRDVRRV